MASEGEERKRPRRNRSGAGVDRVQGTTAIQDGVLVVEVTDMLVWSKLSRGDYNRNQVYAHVAVTPAVPWRVKVPIGELEGSDAVKQALSVLQDAVHGAALEKVAELEQADREAMKRAMSRALESRYGGGVEVQTEVRSAEDRPPLRPSIVASVGEPPDEEDF